jgi:hypothetical protein
VTSTRVSAQRWCARTATRAAGPRWRRRRGRCLRFWTPGHSIANQPADGQIRAGGERDRTGEFQSRFGLGVGVQADADPLEPPARIILHAARRDGEGHSRCYSISRQHRASLLVRARPPYLVWDDTLEQRLFVDRDEHQLSLGRVSQQGGEDYGIAPARHAIDADADQSRRGPDRGSLPAPEVCIIGVVVVSGHGVSRTA